MLTLFGIYLLVTAVGEIHAPPEKTEKSASMDNVYIGVGIGIATLIVAAVVVNLYLYIRGKKIVNNNTILSNFAC